MLILAIDTSQVQSCVCLIQNKKPSSCLYGSTARTHSEGLLGLIDLLMGKAAVHLKDIDAFAVGIGPGSFTGLRIGIATAKAFSQVLEKPMLPFSSLKALNLSVPQELNKTTVAMVNAYQQQVFVGWTDPKERLWKEQAVAPAQWCNENIPMFNKANAAVEFCGSGSLVYWEEIKKLYPNNIVQSKIIYVQAEGITQAIQDKPLLSYQEVHPNYIRPSQAEIKLQAEIAKKTSS